ncbi:hypothetical protein NKV53_00010 [Legionella sp. 27cVA30]|uniref:hypothetical protein n=1 Tax=Legionella sp. 27cVA30 TaxID=2905657 RepID=UPI00209D429D|nr:hypothetical protein [Legionella sp. 27cVA30]MCP0912768.1 hypothetical protein [Legionella sp. 27cVA30]
MRHHSVVLLLQDTTTLNFTGQKERKDIGPINHEKHPGLLLHPILAVTPEKLCLGVLDTYHWAREKYTIEPLEKKVEITIKSLWKKKKVIDG